MNKITLTIPGEPVGKGRPKFSKFGTYTPEKTANYETLVKYAFQKSGQQKLSGPLGADIRAYFTIPKSTPKKNIMPMVDGQIKPTKKPDLDNIAKIILDSLNKAAYDDDSQIAALGVWKYYSDNPRVEILIFEMEG